MDELIGRLNTHKKQDRLRALADLKALLGNGSITPPKRQAYTNNHVHTKYSFSPYSPAKAVWMAYMSGLSTVGIIDHDAINGAEEFTAAGEILRMPTTIGFELRTDWTNTRLARKRINNPDQLSNAYICAHGLPHTQISKEDAYLSGIRNARHNRNRAMTVKLNAILEPHGISIDYDADVLPISCAQHGGTVTERHLLFAAAHKIIEKLGSGQPLARFVSDTIGIDLSAPQRAYLKGAYSENYPYDLLNILKSSFVKRMYIDADTQEAPPVKEVVEKIKEFGAIPTYCYLGDVGASPTGDKKAQKFEDDYLEDVFDKCKRIGFPAVAFMPSRNTQQQLKRVMALCEAYGFLQVSGEDINQPRQSFICEQLSRYSHLIDTTWALVGHETSATKDIRDGLFADDEEPLQQRIDKYKRKAFMQFKD